MRPVLLVRTFAIITALTALVIAYGSLYPFAFYHPENGPGALNTILQSWNHRPGRGDFASNIILYVPFGFFGMSALGDRLGSGARACLVLLFGAALSISIEMLQYYDAGRDTEATDIYSNIIGTG